jgi:polyhydroxybutyrate depolymerase
MNTISMLLVATALAAAPLCPGDYTRTLQVEGRTRSYLVHIPPRYSASPTPVVLAFHGVGDTARKMVWMSGLSEKADQAGFIVVYPSGSGPLGHMLSWNGGNCCTYAKRNDVDDVGFTRCVLDDLATFVSVDAKRVFATGISNGGILCYRLASELSDRIAAIAPISGTMGQATCNPRRPVSVMHFHGTDDPVEPFNGGVGLKIFPRLVFYSVDDTIRAWVQADGCPTSPTVVDLPTPIDDCTTVQQRTYGPGNEGSEVILFIIRGGGHTWPGRNTIHFLGRSTHNIVANDLMWEFFQRHPMP